MAWRAIQSTVGVSTSLGSLTDVQERIWWRLLAHSDPWGRLDARPAKVRALCWPMLTHITDQVAGQALLELQRLERIVVFEKDGHQVIQIVDFEEHQPREAFRKRPTKSSFPDPPAAARPDYDLVTRLFRLDSGHLPETFRKPDETPRYAGVSGTTPEPLRKSSGSGPDETRRDEKEKRREEPAPAPEPQLQDAAPERAREPDPTRHPATNHGTGAGAGDLERINPTSLLPQSAAR